MRWPASIKVFEFGLGFGTAVFFCWIPLSLLLLIVLRELGPAPGLAARLLVAACSGLGLLACMGLSGFLAGLFLSSGRWTFSLTATAVAVIFRAAVFIVSSNPDPPWRGAPEIGIHLASIAGAIALSAWTFKLAQRLGSRGQGGEPDTAFEPGIDYPPANRRDWRKSKRIYN